MHSLFLEFVGFLNYTPQTFFILEPVEIVELMEKARQRIKFEHELQYVAVANAIGGAFSKKHKYQDVFKNEKQKKQVTDEEREEMRKFLEYW